MTVTYWNLSQQFNSTETLNIQINIHFVYI